MVSIISCDKIKNNNENLNSNEIIEIEKIKSPCDENFNSFFNFFSNDSLFQKKRVKFPLSYKYYDDSNYDELVKSRINVESDFKFIDFKDDYKAINNDTGKYTIEQEVKKDKATYVRLGYDNGIYIIYEFQLIDCCWYLIEIIDQST